MNALQSFLERGPERRAALENALAYYIPPELRGWLGLANELNPVVSMERAGGSARAVADPTVQGWDKVAAVGDMTSNMANALAPVVLGSSGAVPAANAVEEALLGFSAASPMAYAARDFATDEFGGVKLLPGQSLDDALRAKYPDVKLSVTGSPERGYTLGQIVVPKDQRGAGVGSSVMRDLLETADEQGATVALTPSGDFGGSVARLREFYKRFGFIPNKGRNADYSISEAMYRLPNSRNLSAGIGGTILMSDMFQQEEEEPRNALSGFLAERGL